MPEFEPRPVVWSREKVARYWDFVAAHQVEPFFSSFYGRTIAELIIRRRPGLFVDIGCGTGDLLLEVARGGVPSVGVDSSADLLDVARSRVRDLTPAPELLVGDSTDLPVDSGSADAAALIEVVEHLDDESLDAILSEARRILRRGGALIVTTPNAEDLSARTVQCPDCGAEFHTIQHVRSWTPASLRDRLRQHGFEVSVRATRVVENGPWHERLARSLYYRLARLTPHLVAIGEAR